MFFSKKTSLCLLFFLSFSGVSLGFDTTDATMGDLNIEQARLNKLNSRINQVVSAYDELTLIRDSYYSGDQGVTTRSAQWLDNANAQVAALNAIADTVTSYASLNSPSVRQALLTEVQTTLTAISDLLADGASIRQDANIALTKLSVIRHFPITYIEHYDNNIAAMQNHKQQLTDSLSTIINTIDVTTTDNLYYSAKTTQEVLDRLLSKAQLQFPELSSALRSVQGMILRETVVAPLVRDIVRKRNEINGLIQNNRIFAAEKELTIIFSLLEASINKISTSLLPDGEKQNAIDDITNLTSIIQSEVENQLIDAPVSVAYLYEDAMAVTSVCTNNIAARSRYDCDLLKSLVGFDFDSILALSDGHLRMMEELIIQVFNGPLRKEQ